MPGLRCPRCVPVADERVTSMESVDGENGIQMYIRGWGKAFR